MSSRQTSGLALARHYLEVGRPQAALDALAGVTGDELDDAEYWAIRAEALLELDRAVEGAEAARRGLEHDPEDMSLLDALALCELNRGRPAAARQALDSALAILPDHPVLLSHHALALALDKRYDARAARPWNTR